VQKYFKIISKDSLWFKLSFFIIKNVRISILLSLILLSSCLIYIYIYCQNYNFWLTNKFQQALYSKESLYNFAKLIKNKSQLDNRLDIIDQLKQEIEIYKYENTQLKNLLNFLNNKVQKSSIVTTKTIVAPGNKELIINLPTERVRVDQIVINQSGIVGKISKVYPGFAKAIFITNKKFRIPVISTQTLNRFIAYGDGVFMKPLFLSEPLKDGELITSAINDERIPVGIFCQKTNAIEPVNKINKLDFVSILADE